MKENNLEERLNKLEAENKKKNKQLGITLVALVVTIIIMLIIAGITVAQLSGSNLFENVKLAKQKYKDAQDLEENILSSYENASLNGVVSTRDGENPAGTLIAFAADNAPEGYLECNGQEVSRTTYSKLFNVIGTKYGAGDGSTTFNVPDLRGEFLRGTGENPTTGHSGANVGTHQNATKHVAIYGSSTYSEIGVANTSPSEPDTVNSNVNKYVASSTKGSYNGSSITGNSFTSRPTNTSVLYCIKY